MKAEKPSGDIIAVFDYDNTLVKGDSLWPFLVCAAGRLRTVLALFEAILLLPLAWFRGCKDCRTFIKQKLLFRILRGKSLDEIKKAGEKMRTWPREKEQQVKALKEHYAAGHHIVIATGSLDIYLPFLLEKIPHHAVLCTEMEIKDSVLTGVMASGNCVRSLKAKRVKEYMEAKGNFSDSWGYGNYPHDLPMLELVNHKTVVD